MWSAAVHRRFFASRVKATAKAKATGGVGLRCLTHPSGGRRVRHPSVVVRGLNGRGCEHGAGAMGC